jgi:hypothetical protein
MRVYDSNNSNNQFITPITIGLIWLYGGFISAITEVYDGL